MLVLALLVVGVGGAKGVTLNASFQTPASNGSWNAGTNTYSWTGSYSNLMTIFSFSGGQLANYTSLHLTTSDYTDSYRVCFMNGSTAVATIAFYSAGQKDLVLADRTETKDLDLSTVTHISFGGNSNSGSVTLTNVYLEGPDPLYREVFALGSPITFAQALASSEPYVLVSQEKVFCLSGGDITYKDVSEISDCAWTVKFEEDADVAGSYYMRFYDSSNNPKGYVNASVWSHTWLSGVDKTGTKGEQQDGALWTVTLLPSGKYAIRNVGDVEGSYGDDHKSQGYLALATSGYWANHVTHYNTSGEWEFYTLGVQNLPANDCKMLTWEQLTFDGAATVDNDKRIVSDSRDWAFYWATSAHWDLPEGSRDISDYKYLVVYSTQNASDHSAAVYITDGNGTTMRGSDYKQLDDTHKYPEPLGSMVLDTWSNQHIAVVDLQFLANTDKFGDGSACKYIDTKNVTSIGISASAEGACLNFAYLTNTLPNTNGDYTRAISAFDKFGTICLPYPAVCSGAQVFEITSKGESYLGLSQVYGVMEAGKPYLYKTVESQIGYWGGSAVAFKDEEKVYFFRAGYEQVDAPVPNNGLIGTFTNTTAPQGSDIYVLSNNRLYDTEGSTVTIGANKAYIDMAQVPTGGGAARDIMLYFGDADETTGIADMSSQKADVKAIYNLQGQRVNRLQKGLNIVNGKKVLMK